MFVISPIRHPGLDPGSSFFLGSSKLTRDIGHTLKARASRDADFAKALLDEAATAFLNGKADTARLILRDLVNASLGFETLAAETGKPAKSLHRMPSQRGNSSMDDLTAIFGAVRKRFGGGLAGEWR